MFSDLQQYMDRATAKNILIFSSFECQLSWVFMIYII